MLSITMNNKHRITAALKVDTHIITCLKYRTTAALKVDTHIITSITASLIVIGRPVILYSEVVRKDMEVNGHKRLFNTKLKEYLKLLNRLYLHNLVWVSLRFS